MKYFIRIPVTLWAFIIGIVLIGWLQGYLNTPGICYENLTKPAFNPPNWVFGPVWTLLYIAIAIAGWRTWHSDKYGKAMGIWIAQMLLNFAWSPVFFNLHLMDLALIILVLMFGAIIGFIVSRWRIDPTSARLFIPYAAWVVFAGYLNSSLLWLN
jgi:tryptophan-rich sensory protein